MRRVYFWLLPLFCVVLLINPQSPALAQPDTNKPLRITPQADGVRLEWDGDVAVTRSGTPTVPGWPGVEINGLRLPAQVVALHVPDGRDITPDLAEVRSVPWAGALEHVDVPIPQTVDGKERPALAAMPGQTPPAAPVVVLHDGWMRGTRIVVLAVTPVFEQDGALRAATALQIHIPGATPLAEDAHQILARSSPFLANAAAPTNPVVGRAIAKVHVSAAGMQRVTGADLAAAGIDLQTLPPARLHLWRNGVQVALEEHGTGDGRLDPADELWFYAPPLDDRWNTRDTYWLTVESGSGVRMTTRDARPGSDSVTRSDSAFERGVWRNNQIYDPTLPGPDSDHWYAADLRTGPGQPAATLSAVLTPTLPPVAGDVTLTVSGSAYTEGRHTLAVGLGGASQTTTWEGTGTWTRTVTLAGTGTEVSLRLVPGSQPDGIEVDSIAWERPVRLDFNSQGATFIGRADLWRYDLTRTPSGRRLYDISSASRPERLVINDGTTTQFVDGPAQRHYLLTGPGTLHTPEVAAYEPVNLAAALNAGALYIAPASLHAALAPLIDHRRAQGHTVHVIDVQEIYDAWSFGQVSPEAIRAFLRYAAASWNRPPASVVLVGDGTADPHDYTQKGENNVNLIPPYLAMVDPWIGETACETCYAQLNGDDPVSSPDADMFPDVALGRLPVKSAAELEQLVAKIIRYETDPQLVGWRARNVYIADNFREADGTIDSAGDFARLSEISIAQQPAGMSIRRVYYDPWKRDASGAFLHEPWREPDAAQARARTFAALNAGAGLVNYLGHSNHWRWAVTDQSETNHLLSLFEADALTNGDRLPIILSMTCWTSAFHHPARSGTTLDERLVLNPQGGGVAVWGPAGLGVAYGHDALQRGFYDALWAAPPLTAPLGELTMAGYLEVLTQSGCCYDVVQTYILLGDPLTTARVFPGATSLYLPLAGTGN